MLFYFHNRCLWITRYRFDSGLLALGLASVLATSNLAGLEMAINQLAGAFVALGKLIQVQILLALDACENKLQHLVPLYLFKRTSCTRLKELAGIANPCLSIKSRPNRRTGLQV